MKFEQKKKRPLALWTTAFKSQHKALRPENTAAGGVNARSQPESVRMAVYVPIKDLYLKAHPFCECHETILKTGHIFKDGSECGIYRVKSSQNHHKNGRDGLLLFDIRHFCACCASCHTWIDAHRAQAQKLGLLAKEGWRKQDA